MEDISGDQWEHFAAVSRNAPVTHKTPAFSSTHLLALKQLRLGLMAALGARVRCGTPKPVSASVPPLPALALRFINERLRYRGALPVKMDFLAIQG